MNKRKSVNRYINNYNNTKENKSAVDLCNKEKEFLQLKEPIIDLDEVNLLSEKNSLIKENNDKSKMQLCGKRKNSNSSYYYSEVKSNKSSSNESDREKIICYICGNEGVNMKYLNLNKSDANKTVKLIKAHQKCIFKAEILGNIQTTKKEHIVLSNTSYIKNWKKSMLDEISKLKESKEKYFSDMIVDAISNNVHLNFKSDESYLSLKEMIMNKNKSKDKTYVNYGTIEFSLEEIIEKSYFIKFYYLVLQNENIPFEEKEIVQNFLVSRFKNINRNYFTKKSFMVCIYNIIINKKLYNEFGVKYSELELLGILIRMESKCNKKINIYNDFECDDPSKSLIIAGTIVCFDKFITLLSFLYDKYQCIETEKSVINVDLCEIDIEANKDENDLCSEISEDNNRTILERGFLISNIL